MARKVGQIIARGDRRWLIRVYLGRDHETSKRNYHNRTIHGSMREAQAYLTRKLRERDLGRDQPTDKNITVLQGSFLIGTGESVRQFQSEANGCWKFYFHVASLTGTNGGAQSLWTPVMDRRGRGLGCVVKNEH